MYICADIHVYMYIHIFIYICIHAWDVVYNVFTGTEIWIYGLQGLVDFWRKEYGIDGIETVIPALACEIDDNKAAILASQHDVDLLLADVSSLAETRVSDRREALTIKDMLPPLINVRIQWRQ